MIQYNTRNDIRLDIKKCKIYIAGQMLRTNFGKFPKKIDSQANRTQNPKNLALRTSAYVMSIFNDMS